MFNCLSSQTWLSMQCTYVTRKSARNIPAPLIIDPDVLLALLQSLSVLMSFSQQVETVHYMVRSFSMNKLVLKIIIC